MYVDYSIPVCQKLPQRVLDDIALLNKYYTEDDTPNYVMLEESAESDLKIVVNKELLLMMSLKLCVRGFGECDEFSRYTTEFKGGLSVLDIIELPKMQHEFYKRILSLRFQKLVEYNKSLEVSKLESF